MNHAAQVLILVPTLTVNVTGEGVCCGGPGYLTPLSASHHNNLPCHDLIQGQGQGMPVKSFNLWNINVHLYNNVNNLNFSGDNSLKLCELCAGWNQGRGSMCSESDLYAGYEGAFMCMASGSGELAFLTHTTVQEMVDSRRGYSKANFRLLCTDGSMQSVDRYANCHWGMAPPHAVVTSSSVLYPQRRKLQDMLMVGQI